MPMANERAIQVIDDEERGEEHEQRNWRECHPHHQNDKSAGSTAAHVVAGTAAAMMNVASAIARAGACTMRIDINGQRSRR